MRKWLLQLSVSGGILGLLFWRARVWQLGDAFQDFEVWAGVLVLALNVPILLMITLRSWLVLRRIHADVSFRGLIRIAAVGNLAGQLTPLNAGDLWRAYAYKRAYGVPVSQGAAAVVYERFMSFYLMGLAAIGLALYQFLLRDIGPAILVLIVTVMVATAFLPALLYPALRSALTNSSAAKVVLAIAERTPLRGVRSAFEEGEGSLRLMLEDRSLTLAFAGPTSVFLALSGLQAWAILVGLDLGLQFQEVLLVLLASAAAGAVSSLPFGLGVTDGGLVLLLSAYGVSVGAAVTVSVLVRALMTLPLGLVGVGSYLMLNQGQSTEVGKEDAEGTLPVRG